MNHQEIANFGNYAGDFRLLYYNRKNFCNLIGSVHLVFQLTVWNTYMWKLQTFCDISKFSQISITFNNFEISLVVFMPNITTNHAITCTNLETGRNGSKSGASRIIRESWLTTEDNYFIINHPNYELINCSFSCLLHPFVKFSVSERTGCTVDVVYFIDDILRARFPQTVFDFTRVRR